MRLLVIAAFFLLPFAAQAKVVADRKPDLDSSGSHFFVTLFADDEAIPDASAITLTCMAGGQFDVVLGPLDRKAEELTYSLDGGPTDTVHYLMIEYDPESRFLHDLAVSKVMEASIDDGPQRTYNLDGIYDAIAPITRNCEVN